MGAAMAGVGKSDAVMRMQIYHALVLALAYICAGILGYVQIYAYMHSP